MPVLVDPLTLTRSRLLAIPAVTAIVGSRIYAGLLPQNPVLPAIAMQVIDRVESEHLRGPAGDRVRRVQVHAVARTRHEAMLLANAAEVGDGVAIGAGLSHYRGYVGSVFVKGIFPGGTEREDYRADPQNEYEVMRDYLVHLEER